MISKQEYDEYKLLGYLIGGYSDNFYVVDNLISFLSTITYEPDDYRYYPKFITNFVANLSKDKNNQPENVIRDPDYSTFSFEVSRNYDSYSSYYLLRVLVIKLLINNSKVLFYLILATNNNIISLAVGESIYYLLDVLKEYHNENDMIILVQNLLAKMAKKIKSNDKYVFSRVCYTDLKYLDQSIDNCLITLGICINSLIKFLQKMHYKKNYKKIIINREEIIKTLNPIINKIKPNPAKCITMFVLQYYIYYNYDDIMS